MNSIIHLNHTTIFTMLCYIIGLAEIKVQFA